MPGGRTACHLVWLIRGRGLISKISPSSGAIYKLGSSEVQMPGNRGGSGFGQEDLSADAVLGVTAQAPTPLGRLH